MPSLSEIWKVSGLVPWPCARYGPLVFSGLPFRKLAVEELMMQCLARGLECLSCLPLCIRRKTDHSVSQHCLGLPNSSLRPSSGMQHQSCHFSCSCNMSIDSYCLSRCHWPCLWRMSFWRLCMWSGGSRCISLYLVQSFWSLDAIALL